MGKRFLKSLKFKEKEVKKMKGKLITGIMAAMLVLFLAVSAHAVSISTLYDTTATNILSDQSYEYLINPVGTSDTTVDKGDRLRGIIRVDQLLNNNGQYTYGLDWSKELTAIFDITVTGKAGDAINGYTWTFGPSAAFTSVYGAGAMIAIFEDSANDFNGINTTIAAAEASATNGSSYWTLGFLGLAGEGWAASAFTDDIALLPTTTGSNAGTVNFGINMISLGVGPGLYRDQVSLFGGLVDVNGSGNFINKGALNTPFDVIDDVNASFHPVPEPATLSLVGFGLVGLGSFVRRKFKK